MKVFFFFSFTGILRTIAHFFVVVGMKEPQNWLDSNVLGTWFYGFLCVTFLWLPFEENEAGKSEAAQMPG